MLACFAERPTSCAVYFASRVPYSWTLRLPRHVARRVAKDAQGYGRCSLASTRTVALSDQHRHVYNGAKHGKVDSSRRSVFCELCECMAPPSGVRGLSGVALPLAMTICLFFMVSVAKAVRM